MILIIFLVFRSLFSLSIVPLKNEKKDLLGTLIAASAGEKNPMTAEDIRHHLLTFFAAGHETTSSTLLWVFFEICQNREIMV